MFAEANHIANLTGARDKHAATIATVRQSIQDFKRFLAGSKFTGTENGERKDWISTGDVNRWLSELDSQLQD